MDFDFRQYFNNGQDVDWTEAANAKETIPAGKYKFIVTALDVRESKKTGDAMLSVTFQVCDGAENGTLLFQLYLLGHSDEKVKMRNMKQFGKLCIACGVPNAQRSVELMHKQFMGTITEKEDDFGWKNEIKKYEPLEGLAALQQEQAVQQPVVTTSPAPVQRPTPTPAPVQQPTQAVQPVNESDLEFE